MAGAQAELEQSFELRRDALAGVADQIPNALSDNREEALDAIAADMKTLLASDVLYERARGEIQVVLREEEIAGEVPGERLRSRRAGPGGARPARAQLRC